MSSATQRVLNGEARPLRRVDRVYDNTNSLESAQELAYEVKPAWQNASAVIELTRFDDGITNTLLKITKRDDNTSQEERDADAVLLRAYGNNTEIIIDRDREAAVHSLLSELGLAPRLLARFKNGLLYEYIPGETSTPEDLTREPVWRGVARKLGEWHARLPVAAVVSALRPVDSVDSSDNGIVSKNRYPLKRSWSISTRTPHSNIWAVMQDWINVLPASTEKEISRRDLLQEELERSFRDLDNDWGIGHNGLVVGHCDLLSGNVIIRPQESCLADAKDTVEVAFVDYEYSVPCAAAFDIANHFAEWGGFDCNYNMLPTSSTRRAWLEYYLASYCQHSSQSLDAQVLDDLYAEIDKYRGMPGLYWGIWALIQATISKIDFDYASYAEIRLGEYWAWRAEEDGSRKMEGTEMPLRERRWAEP